jgi:hypothetical protein
MVETTQTTNSMLRVATPMKRGDITSTPPQKKQDAMNPIRKSLNNEIAKQERQKALDVPTKEWYELGNVL